MSINVAIVEKDKRVFSGLAGLLEATNGFRCAGPYSSAISALNEFPKSLPDVVLMDINLPCMNGVEYVRRIKEAHPCQLILVLTHLDDPQVAFNTLSAGASGYLLKSASPEQIVTAIQEVYRGGSPITGSIARGLVNLLQQTAVPGQNYRNLSLREQQVLGFLAKGLRYKEIAGALAISYSTAHAHIRHIYRKLRVNCRTDAVTLYLREYPNRSIQALARQYKMAGVPNHAASSRNLIGAMVR